MPFSLVVALALSLWLGPGVRPSSQSRDRKLLKSGSPRLESQLWWLSAHTFAPFTGCDCGSKSRTFATDVGCITTTISLSRRPNWTFAGSRSPRNMPVVIPCPILGTASVDETKPSQNASRLTSQSGGRAGNRKAPICFDGSPINPLSVSHNNATFRAWFCPPRDHHGPPVLHGPGDL